MPNARLLTLDAINAETAATAVPGKGGPVLAYCRSGVCSAEAALPVPPAIPATKKGSAL